MSDIKGKYFFSDKPSESKSGGDKQKFKSSEFIYGRLELPTTVQEFFKVPATTKKRPFPFLHYKIQIARNGKEMGSNPWKYTRIGVDELKSNFWNFDVLPDPGAATTMMSGTDDFSSGKASAPLYSMFDQSVFPADGEYTISVKIACVKYDVYEPFYPKPEGEWINCTSEFKFDFSTDDIPNLQENRKKADSLVQDNARRKAIKERGLVKEWHIENSPSTSGLSDDALREAMLAPEATSCRMIKMVIQPPIRGGGWSVEKNASDMPVLRYHNQPVGFFAENNGRFFYIEGNLQQDYAGGGTYEKVYFRHYRADELDPQLVEEALALEKEKPRAFNTGKASVKEESGKKVKTKTQPKPKKK